MRKDVGRVDIGDGGAPGGEAWASKKSLEETEEVEPNCVRGYSCGYAYDAEQEEGDGVGKVSANSGNFAQGAEEERTGAVP